MLPNTQGPYKLPLNPEGECSSTDRSYTDYEIGDIFMEFEGIEKEFMDNIYTERLWKTYKYKYPYLQEISSPKNGYK